MKIEIYAILLWGAAVLFIYLILLWLYKRWFNKHILKQIKKKDRANYLNR
jgi:hypothetical protein